MNNKFDINNDGIVDVTDAMAIVNEIAEAKSAAVRDPLCPEYYGAKGDGLPLYDWPVRCFSGFVDVPEESFERANVNVFAPGESFVNTFKNLPGLISSTSVYFNRATHHFVLSWEGKFYSCWGKKKRLNGYGLSPKLGEKGLLDESDLFDRCSGGDCEYMEDDMPRTDAVFSLLTTRQSFVWKDGQLTDIDTLMTDDYTAIMACLKANNGSMKLRPKACYYMRVWKQQADNNTNPLVGINEFCIDGQGSTIFARRVDAGAVPIGPGGVNKRNVFRFNNAKNGTVKNLAVMALRDRDNGAPSGHYRFSSSDSGLVAFSVISSTSGSSSKYKLSENISFQNIRTKGMYEDFDFRGGRSFAIHNWTSKDVCQNFSAETSDICITNANVTQTPFCGCGMHLLYFGALKVRVFNSTFRQGGPFCSVMLTHHASKMADDIKYINCRFLGHRIAQGTFMQTQEFYFCSFRQIWKSMLTDTAWQKCSAMIVGSKVNWLFSQCDFDIDSEQLMVTTANEEQQLKIYDCSIYGNNVSDIKMIAGFTGKAEGWRNRIQWSGHPGLEINTTN